VLGADRNKKHKEHAMNTAVQFLTQVAAFITVTCSLGLTTYAQEAPTIAGPTTYASFQELEVALSCDESDLIYELERLEQEAERLEGALELIDGASVEIKQELAEQVQNVERKATVDPKQATLFLAGSAASELAVLEQQRTKAASRLLALKPELEALETRLLDRQVTCGQNYGAQVQPEQAQALLDELGL